MAKQFTDLTEDEWRLFYENFLKLEDACKRFRGEYIHAVTTLESIFEQIISVYFCGANGIKSDELTYVLLSTERVTLQTKVQVAFFLTHRYYKNIYNQYSPENPKKGKNQIKTLERRLE